MTETDNVQLVKPYRATHLKFMNVSIPYPNAVSKGTLKRSFPQIIILLSFSFPSVEDYHLLHSFFRTFDFGAFGFSCL